MSKLKFLQIIIIALFVGLLFNSCKKDKTVVVIGMEQTITEDDLANKIFDDLTNQSAMYEGGAINGKTIGPTITISWTGVVHGNFPKTITIDFGTEGFTGFFGRERKGKIIIVQTGSMFVEGSVRTITLENFYIDDYNVEGTQTITCIDASLESSFKYSTVLVGGKVIFPDGSVIKRNSEHTTEWYAGLDTPFYIFDDKWRIEGNITGVSRQGFSYSSVITKPIILDISCKWKFIEGTIRMNIGTNEVLIDYGSGNCDNEITLTINGESKIITTGQN